MSTSVCRLTLHFVSKVLSLQQHLNLFVFTSVLRYKICKLDLCRGPKANYELLKGHDFVVNTLFHS